MPLGLGVWGLGSLGFRALKAFKLRPLVVKFGPPLAAAFGGSLKMLKYGVVRHRVSCRALRDRPYPNLYM